MQEEEEEQEVPNTSQLQNDETITVQSQEENDEEMPSEEDSNKEEEFNDVSFGKRSSERKSPSLKELSPTPPQKTPVS